ncbi:GAF and ANTAR domain-containing protein [Rhodococcus sp. NPDC054953]
MTASGSRNPVAAIRDSLTAALRARVDPLQALLRTCSECLDVLAVDGMSVVMTTAAGHRQTLYASDPLAAEIEALQFSLGEGPSLESVRARGPVLVPDLAARTAGGWPVFGGEVGALPVAAIFAFPLQSGALVLGSMDLYRTAAGWLDTDELAVALQVVDVITLAVLGLGTEPGMPEHHWFADMSHNTDVVHQATGMLVARYQISVGAALARLRGYAFANGRLVEAVARDVTTRQLNLEDMDT